jgi:hypothetical protein
LRGGAECDSICYRPAFGATETEDIVIQEIHYGDITNPDNRRDIIIGMNTALAEASVIGRRVLLGKTLTRPLSLGDVVTFEFDHERQLHMLICHELGKPGWRHADRYVRFGLDYLWQCDNASVDYSIVEIGTGPVGRRDRADAAAILTAMTNSFLPLHLFIHPEQREAHMAEVVGFPPLRSLRIWRVDEGEEDIRVAA